jgi:hypothetical protein
MFPKIPPEDNETYLRKNNLSVSIDLLLLSPQREFTLKCAKMFPGSKPCLILSSL